MGGEIVRTRAKRQLVAVLPLLLTGLTVVKYVLPVCGLHDGGL